MTPKTHTPQYLTLCSITSDMPSIHRNNFMHLHKGLFSHFYPSLLQRSWHTKGICSLPWFFIFPIHYSCQLALYCILYPPFSRSVGHLPQCTFLMLLSLTLKIKAACSLKHCYPPSKLHSITNQKTTFWITLIGKMKTYLLHDCIHSLKNGVSKNEYSVLMDYKDEPSRYVTWPQYFVYH